MCPNSISDRLFTQITAVALRLGSLISVEQLIENHDVVFIALA
jgi:hypothetical protein